MIKRKIDDLGRITLPIEMRKEIELSNGSEVDINVENNKIVLTNSKSMRTREEIDKKLKRMKKDYPFGENLLADGFMNGLKWVLKEKD